MENKSKIIKEFFKYLIFIIEALCTIAYMLYGSLYTVLSIVFDVFDRINEFSNLFEVVIFTICYIILFVLGLAFLIEIIWLTYCLFEKKKFNYIFLINTAGLFFVVFALTLLLRTNLIK